jgi:GNAT superfamily N-acetyltransferase
MPSIIFGALPLSLERINSSSYSMPPDEILFSVESIRAIRFREDNVVPAQAFLEANPAYSLLATGEPPKSGDALRELTERPAPVRSEDLYFLGFWEREDLIAIANVLRTWPVPGISHVGLLHVAEARHGRGMAQACYGALERWMIAQFAPRWLRLGVLATNARALRFWSRMGYHETGRKSKVPYGRLNHELVVMIKPVQGEVDEAYWKLAADSPIPLETPTAAD